MISSFVKLFNLTGAEVWEAPDEWWKSREKDVQHEIPKTDAPAGAITEFPKSAIDANQLLQFVLVVLLALWVSKRL